MSAHVCLVIVGIRLQPIHHAAHVGKAQLGPPDAVLELLAIDARVVDCTFTLATWRRDVKRPWKGAELQRREATNKGAYAQSAGAPG